MSTESGGDERPRVTLPPRALAPFRRLSLYNSPYPAHDGGCAVDLYPDSNDGISPVSGEVIETRTARTPQKSYATEHDYLVLVDCDPEWCAAAGVDELVARILHVDPSVEAGDVLAVGDSVGEMVRSGFFAPWVDNHVHLGFRTPSQNLRRASGSLGIDLPTRPTALPWDGTGTVVETGETYVALDAPTHPGRERGWCGIAADGGGVVDGGLPHYDGGGLFATSDEEREVRGRGEPVSLLGTVVGERTGRTIDWRDIGVTVNDVDAVGLSLFLACDGPAGAKVVCPGHDFAEGDRVTVRIAPTS